MISGHGRSDIMKPRDPGTAINERHPCSLTQREAYEMSEAKGCWTGIRVGISRVLLLLMLALGPLAAQEELEKPPEIPPIDAPDQPLPPKVQQEQLEPAVTIHEEEDRQVEEYRYNGRLYMVKITPRVGLPYYYIDTDGDGNLETTPTKGLEPVQPIHWKIKEWD
jgi:hypothetical protein